MKLLGLAFLIALILVLSRPLTYSTDGWFYVHASQSIGSGMRYLEHNSERWQSAFPSGDWYVAWTPLYPILLAIGQGILSAQATAQLINVLSITGIFMGTWLHLSGQESPQFYR